MKRNKELAEHIAEKIFHHAGKHLHRPNQKEEWSKLGVSNNDELRNHIVKTLLDPETKMLVGINGLTHFYNAKSNTYILDNAAGFNGTCFLPVDKQKYIEQSVLCNENLNRRKQKQTKFQKINLRFAKRQRVINELRLNKNKITLKQKPVSKLDEQKRAEEFAEQIRKEAQELKRSWQKGKDKSRGR